MVEQRSPSREFRALGLRSESVDELLTEISRHASDVFGERMRLLPEDVRGILAAVFAERTRSGADTSLEEIGRVTSAVLARVQAEFSAERIELAGRTVRLRVSRPVMLYATKYYNAGINSTTGPGRHDTPTPLLPPAPVDPNKR